MGRPSVTEAPTTSALPEEVLALRFHEGDMVAFGHLVQPHLDSVYTVILRYVGREAEAEDILQEALVKAMAKHRRFQPGRPIRPWLLTIALNLARSRMRSPWWRRALGLSGCEIAGGVSPEESALGEDHDARIRAALATLPAKYREALALYYLGDLTYAEMSEITGLSVPNLKQRVRRGIPKLRAAVVRMYPDLSLARTTRGDRT